ncbi:unnamed protein product [Blepharisma stoltei]|uniref:peptidylprolyl isomerase n=1 Tax=Blepharisma stoltei TaxID=1481888 RepID=A0AAU9JQP9_9CILI|nr:unnamed protein product [Blepharisma stoltei]
MEENKFEDENTSEENSGNPEIPKDIVGEEKDLFNNGTVFKTITKVGFGYDTIEYKDDITIDITVRQEGATVFQEPNLKLVIVPESVPEALIEILKTMKLKEEAQLKIHNKYFRDNFERFMPNPVTDADFLVDIKIIDMRKAEDMYLDGSFYKRTIEEGAGKDLPNTNAHVRVLYKLDIEGETVLTNFDQEPLEIIMDEDEVPSLWTHCLRQMKEGDLVKVECNLMGLHANYLNDGLDKKYNFDTYAKENQHSAEFYIKLVSFQMGRTNYNMTTQDRADEALRIKEAGNKLFKVGRYDRAVEKYEAANTTIDPITDDPHKFRPIRNALLGNITLCNLKLERWHEAAVDANKILDMNPADVKALYRRGLARKELENLEGALEDFKEAKRVSQEKGDKEMGVTVENEIKRIKAIMKKSYSREKEIYKNLFK